MGFFEVIGIVTVIGGLAWLVYDKIKNPKHYNGSGTDF